MSEIIPVFLGADLNCYNFARAFHKAYGVESYAYGRYPMAPTKYSKIVHFTTVPDMDNEDTMLRILHEFAAHHTGKKLYLFGCTDDYAAMIIRRAVVPRTVIARAPNLKVIAMHGVSRDTIDTAAAAEYGVPVPNVPGLGAPAVAELAVADLLALNRQLKFVNNGLCAGRFDHFGAEEFVCHEMTGRTLGLVGTGNIAHRVADILRAAFDVRVLCWNPRRTAAECAAWGYEQVATLPELFHRSDFVNVSITLCDATRDLINAPVFAAANPDLLLVNTSRGGIVNEHDLYIALTTGQIRAAASDVFVHEPPACDDPLIHLDNFIATFHIGGSTYESLERVSNRAVDYVFEYTGVPEQKEVIGS